MKMRSVRIYFFDAGSHFSSSLFIQLLLYYDLIINFDDSGTSGHALIVPSTSTMLCSLTSCRRGVRM